MDEKIITLKLFKGIDFSRLFAGRKSEEYKFIKNLVKLYFEIQEKPQEEQSKWRRAIINTLLRLIGGVPNEKMIEAFSEAIEKSLGVEKQKK